MVEMLSLRNMDDADAAKRRRLSDVGMQLYTRCGCLTIIATFFLVAASYHAAGALALTTHPQDVDALTKLYRAWDENPNVQWDLSKDPCDNEWLGISCNSSVDPAGFNRVTYLLLLNQNLSGTLSPAIGNLTYLLNMDLSSNGGLGGPLPPEIGNLQHIVRFYVQYCNFSGTIPPEIGNMVELQYLGLSSNNFTGPIPATVGKLSKMIWFDMSYNSLTGPLPVSESSGIHLGLDSMNVSEHIHLQGNQFEGTIPASMFQPYMRLLHLLLAENKFSGIIPSNIYNMKHLDIIRLDHNSLNGTIPNTINQIVNLTTLQLNNNNLTGEVPNLANDTNLQILSLQENKLNGTLDLSSDNLTTLTYVDASNNSIANLSLGNHSTSFNLRMQGNPYCSSKGQQQQQYCGGMEVGAPSPPPPPQTGGLPEEVQGCGNSRLLCADWPAWSVNPMSGSSSSTSTSTSRSGGCRCVQPVVASWRFYALKVPSLLSSLADEEGQRMQELRAEFMEMWAWSPFTHSLPPLAQQQLFIAPVAANVLNIFIFPPAAQDRWSASDATLISFVLQNQDIWFVSIGPMACTFPYVYVSESIIVHNRLSSASIVGIVVAAFVLFLGLLLVGMYAMKLRKRAVRAERLTKPFASWIVSGKEDVAKVPQLKGARWFSLHELQKCTSNFNSSNEIGAGGYGKVYRGYLPSGEIVAIKRSSSTSLQGATEFKNEIELLSRVHHRNLVGLIGFCFEEGEQMLVYKYMANGTLRECLSEKSNVEMTWDKRIEFALGAAKGIAYLHNEANPPIIHRDIKSNNILLDEKFVAMVADFGLSKLAPTAGEENMPSMNVKGTLGYLDPHYYLTNQLTDKSDVYSFGVVMLELMTGRPPIQAGKYIVREVDIAFTKGGVDQVIARKLLDPTLKVYPIDGVERFLELALGCVTDDPLERPTMSEVVKDLEELVDLYSPKFYVPPLDDQQAANLVLRENTKEQPPPDLNMIEIMSSSSDASKARAELYGEGMPYMQQSFGSSSFDYNSSCEAISRPLDPK